MCEYYMRQQLRRIIEDDRVLTGVLLALACSLVLMSYMYRLLITDTVYDYREQAQYSPASQQYAAQYAAQ